MIERGLDLLRFANSPSLYTPDRLAALGPEKYKNVASQVSTELASRRTSMIFYTPEQIVQSIMDSRAAAIIRPDGRVGAFAHYWPYNVDLTGDDFMYGQHIFEIGSWMSFPEKGEKGLGQKVFEAAWRAGSANHPDAGFIAITELNSRRAAKLLELMGGEWVGRKISKQIKNPSTNQAKMDIYRMAKPGR